MKVNKFAEIMLVFLLIIGEAFLGMYLLSDENQIWVSLITFITGLIGGFFITRN